MKAFLRPVTFPLLLATAGGLALSACADVDTGRLDEAVTGPITFENACMAQDQTFVTSIAAQGQAAVSSPIFEECVRRAMTLGIVYRGGQLGPYVPCAGETDADRDLPTQIGDLIANARASNGIRVTCESSIYPSLDSFTGDVLAPGALAGDESITYWLLSFSLGDEAPSLWRASLHQHGYCAKYGTGPSTSADAIVSGCLAGVIAGEPLPPPPVLAEKIAVFRSGTWYRDQNQSGVWDGDPPDRQSGFGVSGDKPIRVLTSINKTATDVIGVYRAGYWYIDRSGNGIWDAADGPVFHFGIASDKPVTGNWSTSGIGVYRNGNWYLDLNGNGVWDGQGPDTSYAFGSPGDIPVVGRWSKPLPGLAATSQLGVFNNGGWALDLNGNGKWDGNGPGRDANYSFGIPGDIPVVGDWDNSGRTKIGVYRGGEWYLDMDGDGAWEDDRDLVVSFGIAGDLPTGGAPRPSGQTSQGGNPPGL